MRIILGCATTAKIEALRRELRLPSIIWRIQEITCRTICRMVCHGASHLQKDVVAIYTNHSASQNSYLRKLCKVLAKFEVVEEFTALTHNHCYTKWSPCTVNVDIEKLSKPKGQWYKFELKAHFLEKLSQYPRKHVLHVYCDGSVEGSKTGCGVFIREFSSSGDYNDYEISKRLPNDLSSTRTELYAILEGLRAVSSMGKNVYFFVDSQSALYELLSSSPADCDIVNKCLNVLHAMESNNVLSYFIWVPSHIGLRFNERVDSLARCAISDFSDDPGTECTYSFIRTLVRNRANYSIVDELDKCCRMGSVSSSHYLQVLNDTQEYVYGRHSALQDLVTMRLRLGYKYYWEVCRGAAPEPCPLCASPGGHSLQHYVLYCPSLEDFRPQGRWELTRLICWFINNDVLPEIIKKCPMFASRF